MPPAPVAPPPLASTGGPGELVSVPTVDRKHLVARVCRPPGDEMFKVVIVNHGAPGAAQVAGMQPPGCGTPAARWFNEHGYIVVAPLRRGFGASDGPVVETSGPCAAPDYVRAGREAARDVSAAVMFAQALPGARPDGTVVIGQSTGGWAVIAYAERPDPGVTKLVSMAGGRGGRAAGQADTYCRPDRLIEAASVFGRSARLPMLWVSAENDSFFSPDLERTMRGAFAGAGGRAELVVTPPFGHDGHRLFTEPGGETVWGPIVGSYLAAPIDHSGYVGNARSGTSRMAASAPSMSSASLIRSTRGN